MFDKQTGMFSATIKGDHGDRLPLFLSYVESTVQRVGSS